MGVSLVIVVPQNELRLLAANNLDKPGKHVIERNIHEGILMLVVLRIRHPRIAVAEHDDLVVADDLGCLLEFVATDLGESIRHPGAIHGGIQYVAGLAAGGGDQHAAHAGIGIARHGSSAL